MRSHSDRPPGGDHLWGAVGGMSLIEAIIYIALLSCLLSGFISYAYAIHQQDLVFMLGQGLGVLIYLRNIFFIHKGK